MTSKVAPFAACGFYLCFGCMLAGCGLFEQRKPETASQSASAKLPMRPSGATSTKLPAPAPVRYLGDFFVHRFSGSFAPEPLTLTEQVVAKEGGLWVVDFALSQAEKVERLRVRFDTATGEPRSVARLQGESEANAKLADYEALMARTMYAADVNDGLLEATSATCLVGADELDCETKTYKIWVGDTAAKLSVTHAARFSDRDVAGEITAEDGKLIYRAELVEATRSEVTSDVALK